MRAGVGCLAVLAVPLFMAAGFWFGSVIGFLWAAGFIPR